MLTEHQHQPGRFDPGHRRDCAREANLEDHYWQVQRQEQAFKETCRWAQQARHHAGLALWSSGVGIVLGAVRSRAPTGARGPRRGLAGRADR